jgi:hypothetical protein
LGDSESGVVRQIAGFALVHFVRFVVRFHSYG